MVAARKAVLNIAVSLLLALIGACEKPLATAPVNEPETGAETIVSLSKAAVAETGVSRLVVGVTGVGMKPIQIDTLITAEGPFRTVLNVPPGKNRIFQVSAYQDTLIVLAGKDSLDLTAGQKVTLNMKLKFQLPALTLTPLDTTLSKNSTFTLHLLAHHVDSLCTIGTMLKFDPAKLQVVELGREDDFLKKNGGAVAQLQFSKDNTAGEVVLRLSIMPAMKNVSGEGKIARIVFKAVDGPNAEIHNSLHNQNPSDIEFGLLDQHGNPMRAIALGSHVTIQ